MNALDHRMIDAHRVALINPLQVDAALWEDLPTQPVVPHAFLNQPHLFPLLVDLHELDGDTRLSLIDREQQWAQQSDTPFLSALVGSGESLTAIKAQLARRLHTVRDGEDRMVRLHDPRVFRHARWLLDGEQINVLFGVIEMWSWPSVSGLWDNLARGERIIDRRFFWTDSQWAALARTRLTNRCLSDIARLMPEQDPDDPALAQRIDHLLADAEHQYGLIERDDRVLFVLQAIRFHSGIHSHQALAERLQRAAAGEQSYVGLCAEFDDDTMRAMAHELNRPLKEAP